MNMVFNCRVVFLSTVFAWNVSALALAIVNVTQVPSRNTISPQEALTLLVEVDVANDVTAFARVTTDDWKTYDDIKHTLIEQESGNFVIVLGPFPGIKKISYKVFVTKKGSSKRIWVKQGNTDILIKDDVREKKSSKDEKVSKPILEQTPAGKELLEGQDLKIKVRLPRDLHPEKVFVRLTKYTAPTDAWKIKEEYPLEKGLDGENEFVKNIGSYFKTGKIEYVVSIIDKYGHKTWLKDGKNNYVVNVVSPDTTALDDTLRNRIEIKVNLQNSIRTSFALQDAQMHYLKQSLTSHRKPNIFVIFFDTLRKDYAEMFGRNMKKFINKNVSPSYYWVNGTATKYSTFSLFNSLPAFLAYDFIPNKDRHDPAGSFPLRVLKELGYDLHMFGYYWNCLPKDDALKDVEWNDFLEQYFGKDTQLIKLCNQPNRDSDLVGAFDENRDPITVDIVKDQIPKILAESDKPNFFFINMYNVHGPFTWKKDLQNELMPSKNRSNPEALLPLGIDWLRNSYANAVMSADLNFAELHKLIRTSKNGDDAVIVLISDHGVHLMEKIGKVGHGNRPFRERSEGVVSFRFGKETEQVKQLKNSDVFSTEDLFPTLFDYLNVEPSPEKLMVGKSLISTHAPGRTSALSVRASGINPTREMAITSNKYKLWIYVDEENFYTDAKGFTVFDITDLDDKPVFDQAPFSDECDLKSLDLPDYHQSCIRFLLKMFSDGIEEIFPGATNI